MNEATFSVAEARKELGDVLSRAHYADERIVISKREKPFAFVGSIKSQERLENLDRLAKAMNMPNDELVAKLMEALADEEKKARLCSIVSDKKPK
jgi:prevent-host-death family protein